MMTGECGSQKPEQPDAQTRRELGRYLMDKIIHEDDLTQRWIGFLITVEAGLAVALGFLLRPGQGTGTPTVQVLFPLLWRGLPILIPLIGIWVARALCRLAVENQQWQGFYVAKFNALPGFEEWVFPSDRGVLGRRPHEQPLGSFGRTIRGLERLITWAWTALLLAALSDLLAAFCPRLGMLLQ